jgi:hypothetical protein
MGNVKKPNRAARMQKKAEHAETFEKGFSMGYGMGYNQAIKDAAAEAIDLEEYKKHMFKSYKDLPSLYKNLDFNG